jgi:hypothetical protein
MSDKIIKLNFADRRLEELHQKILDLIYQDATGCSFAAVVGVLELVKKEIIENQEEDL